MSNFLAFAFDSVRRSAMQTARRALPQHCELCAVTCKDRLLCGACTGALPRPGPSCPVCALSSANGVLCGACLVHPPPYAATIAAYLYTFPVDRLMQALKYHGHLALAEWGALAILEERQRRQPLPTPHRIVAMPLSSERQRERGYNQAFEIAHVIARHTGIASLPGAVRRVRATPPQAALPWSERASNVRGAFSCNDDLTGLDIAVVDDVMTTGASLGELARTLTKAGAARVENWVVARTPPPA